MNFGGLCLLCHLTALSVDGARIWKDQSSSFFNFDRDTDRSIIIGQKLIDVSTNTSYLSNNLENLSELPPPTSNNSHRDGFIDYNEAVLDLYHEKIRHEAEFNIAKLQFEKTKLRIETFMNVLFVGAIICSSLILKNSFKRFIEPLDDLNDTIITLNDSLKTLNSSLDSINRWCWANIIEKLLGRKKGLSRKQS